MHGVWLLFSAALGAMILFQIVGCYDDTVNRFMLLGVFCAASWCAYLSGRGFLVILAVSALLLRNVHKGDLIYVCVFMAWLGGGVWIAWCRWVRLRNDRAVRFVAWPAALIAVLAAAQLPRGLARLTDFAFGEFAVNLAHHLPLIWSLGRTDPLFPIREAAITCYGAMIGVLVVGLCDRSTALKGARALAIIGAAAAAYTVYQYVDASALRERWGSTRAHGTFDDPNSMGTFLGAMLLLQSYLGHAGKGRWRWAMVGAAAVTAGGLFATGSRTAWVATAVVLAGGSARWVIVTVADANKSARLRAFVGAGAMAALLGVLALGAWLRATPVEHPSGSLWSRLHILAHGPREIWNVGDMAARKVWWQTAWANIQDAPWTGHGAGTYRALSVQFQPPQNLFGQENAHNYFLQVWADLGILGFGFWVSAALFCIGQWMARLFGYRMRGPDSAPAMGIWAGLTVFVLTLPTGHPLLLGEALMLFWSMWALALRLGAASSGDPGQAGSPDQRRSPGAAAPLPLAEESASRE